MEGIPQELLRAKAPKPSLQLFQVQEGGWRAAQASQVSLIFSSPPPPLRVGWDPGVETNPEPDPATGAWRRWWDSGLRIPVPPLSLSVLVKVLALLYPVMGFSVNLLYIVFFYQLNITQLNIEMSPGVLIAKQPLF